MSTAEAQAVEGVQLYINGDPAGWYRLYEASKLWLAEGDTKRAAWAEEGARRMRYAGSANGRAFDAHALVQQLGLHLD